jgi:hypothetical protein
MTAQAQYVQQHSAALQDAFDKISAHLRHNCYDGGCSLCEPSGDSVTVELGGDYE